MQKLFKAKKNIAGLRFSVTAGDIVNGIQTGPCFTIYPLHRNDISIAGIPAHYLEEQDSKA